MSASARRSDAVQNRTRIVEAARSALAESQHVHLNEIAKRAAYRPKVRNSADGAALRTGSREPTSPRPAGGDRRGSRASKAVPLTPTDPGPAGRGRR